MNNIDLNKKQTGGATLIMTFVLIIAMGLMSVYSAQVTVTEQKISANHYRTKQGFEAAQAGLDAVLGLLNVGLVNTATANGASGTSTSFADAGIPLPSLNQGGASGNLQSVGSYSVIFHRNSLDPNIIDIEVSGFSGDNHSTKPNQIITQSVMPISLMTYKPPTPLIARKQVLIGNNVSISNKTNSDASILPKAIWSGGTTVTNILGINANIDVISQDGNLDGGTGIYENDRNLANLTGDEFFQNFFTASKQNIKNKIENLNCANSCSGNDLIDNNGNPIAQIIWVDTINPFGNPGMLKIDSAITVGSALDPVLLIVDGNVEIDDSNAEINGIVYTTGDFTNNTGAGNIKGSLISEGSITASGNLDLEYANNSLSTLINTTSRYLRIAGTWKDF